LKVFLKHLEFSCRGSLGNIIGELRHARNINFTDDGNYIDVTSLSQRIDIQHNAWLQNLLDINWDTLLSDHFVGFDQDEKTDRARIGVYYLIDWLAKRGRFTKEEIVAQARQTKITISDDEDIRRETLEALLYVLTTSGYLLRDSRYRVVWNRDNPPEVLKIPRKRTKDLREPDAAFGEVTNNTMRTVIAQRVDRVTTEKVRALNLGPLNVFISYRRSDAAGHAGRLYDRLISHFGAEHVFMDIDAIKPSDNFVETIENAVTSCHILVAIIGRQWMQSTDGGNRLHDATDFVRLEIVTALNLGIRVLPVLVQGALMPQSKDLPEELKGLVQRQALELSDLRWQHDTDQLLKVIEEVAVEGPALDTTSFKGKREVRND